MYLTSSFMFLLLRKCNFFIQEFYLHFTTDAELVYKCIDILLLKLIFEETQIEYYMKCLYAGKLAIEFLSTFLRTFNLLSVVEAYKYVAAENYSVKDEIPRLQFSPSQILYID